MFTNTAGSRDCVGTLLRERTRIAVAPNILCERHSPVAQLVTYQPAARRAEAYELSLRAATHPHGQAQRRPLALSAKLTTPVAFLPALLGARLDLRSWGTPTTR